MKQKQQSYERPFIFEVVVREDNQPYFVELNRPQTGKYKVDYYGRCDDPNCIFLMSNPWLTHFGMHKYDYV